MGFFPEDFCFLCLKSSIVYDYVCSLKCNGHGRPSQICFTRISLSMYCGVPVVLPCPCVPHLAGVSGHVVIPLYQSC